jgi:ABC-type glycerol-3-phosphate transport system substrate-binding protein
LSRSVSLTSQQILDVQGGAGQFDVFDYFYFGLGALVDAGALVDLTDQLTATDTSDFLPSVYDAYTLLDGRRYGVPFDGDVHVLYYNREVFETYGLAPPATWDEYDATALRVVREIAAPDGSIAQLLGYHYVNVANLWWVGGVERWGSPSAAGQWLWGDAVNPTDPDLVLVRDGSGYRLGGRKTFATGVSVGDASVVSGAVDGESLLVVVPRDAAGLVPGGDWDNLGQRLSASGSVTFTDVAIAPEQVLGGTRPPRAPRW